jgi:hypothetical protein
MAMIYFTNNPIVMLLDLIGTWSQEKASIPTYQERREAEIAATDEHELRMVAAMPEEMKKEYWLRKPDQVRARQIAFKKEVAAQAIVQKRYHRKNRRRTYVLLLLLAFIGYCLYVNAHDVHKTFDHQMTSGLGLILFGIVAFITRVVLWLFE